MVEPFDLLDRCVKMPYSKEVLTKCSEFSCGNRDLDEFFRKDVFLYEDEMLGKTHCWVTKSTPHNIVAVVTVGNDSIKSAVLPKNSRNRFNRTFNNEKRNLTYPATLIGRLGVNVMFQGKHIGRQVMNMIKKNNILAGQQNACRFLVVDAYNNPDTLSFYENNGFVYMHKTEDVERMALKRYDEIGNLIYEVPDKEPLLTRMMYFDLKKLSDALSNS